MSTQPELVRHPDAARLVDAVAEALADRLTSLQAEGRVPRLVLTGGGIADAVHRSLAALPRAQGPDWRRLELWWGDERYVESYSSDRNARQAHAALLDSVDVDPSLVHEAPAADSGLPLDQAAARWAQDFPAEDFDVVMLGIGPDGHTASLFPGLSQVREATGDAVWVPDSPKPPPLRLTMTLSRLCRTSEVWFVVSGEGKAEALSAALAPGADVNEVPAAGPVGRTRTLWWVDEAAASRLPAGA